jgi:hypothetical protein
MNQAPPVPRRCGHSQTGLWLRLSNVSLQRSLVVQRWVVLGVFLVGVWLRWTSLGAMDAMLHHDEAYNAVDASRVLRDPQLTPFFPGNFGRESGFVYWLLPFVWLLNGDPLAVRLAATIIGILTLAATYKLGGEVLGPQGAVWPLAALSVFYWHVHLSHLALRGNLFVLCSTVSAAWLMQAHRTNRLDHWLRAGVALGCVVYTYFASAVWIGYAGLSLLVWFICDEERRRGAILALASAVVIALPMLVYIPTHSEYFFGRPETVAVLNEEGLVRNLQLWTRAWFDTGDTNAAFNLPGRPILGPYLGGLWGIGLVGVFFLSRRKWQGGWLIGWSALACLPSLMSDQAPHFLRAAGMIVPTALIIGAGAWAVARALYRWGKTPLVQIVPLLILAFAGKITYVDFHQNWLQHPETFMLMEQPLNQAIDLIRNTVPQDVPVYFSPFSPAHPVIDFRSVDLAPRRVGAFDSHQCLVISDDRSAYVSLTIFEPGFRKALSQWRDTTVLYEDPGTSGTSPRYTVFLADAPRSAFGGRQPWVSFDDLLQVRAVQPISRMVDAGTTLPVMLAVKAERAPEYPLSIFVHLYNDLTPYEGGRIWAQADSQICATYPTVLWRADETIVQPFDLLLPPTTPPGRYVIAMGVYLSSDGSRLPITEPASSQHDYFALKEISVLLKQPIEGNGG